jgi:hypothetical protein
MLVDGEDLGDWLAGIIIGVLSGLFNCIITGCDLGNISSRITSR